MKSQYTQSDDFFYKIAMKIKRTDFFFCFDRNELSKLFFPLNSRKFETIIAESGHFTFSSKQPVLAAALLRAYIVLELCD